MSPPSSGPVVVDTLADGTRAFRLRLRADGRRERVTLHERRECSCGCGGGWTERTAHVELENVLARVRAGVWQSSSATQADAGHAGGADAVPTFHEYASWWLQAKVDGVIGHKPIDANTRSDYRWRLTAHLLPFFGAYRLDEIDRQLCLRFKEAKLREAEELRVAIAAGAVLRDRHGRRLRPLGLASIKKLNDTLAAILDEAIEDEHIERNPARGRRMRVRPPKPPRTFLEMDELVALIDAAGEQDGPLVPVVRTAPEADPGSTRGRVAAALARGLRPAEIAAELGLAKSTVTFHLRRLDATPARAYQGRRALCGTLARTGMRASEVCDLRIGHVRLHDPGGARLRIPDAKTEAGVREVQLSPDLVEELVSHFDRLRRAGKRTDAEAYAFQNARGGRLSRQRVGGIVSEAAELASERVAARGMPPLPRTTPHTLRRTYISIALLANRFDVLWVMGQVGHADSKMTLDVYAQLQQRVKREHGMAFDRLVDEAREQLYGADTAALKSLSAQPLGHGLGHDGPNAVPEGVEEGGSEVAKPADLQEDSRMARPGLEPGTPRFSVVCSTN